MNKQFLNPAVLFTIFITVIITVIAIVKIGASFTKNPTVAVNDNTVVATSSTNNLSQVAVNAKAVFNAPQLAKHSSKGDCYLAYAGVVYDVSKNSKWKKCSHQGVKGGKDITAGFPHVKSIISGMPVVGIYTGPANTAQQVGGNDESEEWWKFWEGEDDD